MPSLANFFKVLNSFSHSKGVSTDVGSSIIKSFGFCNNARIISTRCLSPADKSPIKEDRFTSSP